MISRIYNAQYSYSHDAFLDRKVWPAKIYFISPGFYVDVYVWWLAYSTIKRILPVMLFIVLKPVLKTI